MSDQPWLDDACSLVDAFRAGTLSPTEALDASLAAIDASDLNAFSHLDVESARGRRRPRPMSPSPSAGCPSGIKELEPVDRWPYTEASLVFADRISDHDSTQVTRLRAAGAVLAGQTTASEFGGINCTSTKLHGTTRNPWNPERTPGGSSGGTAAAVAGGLLPIASGGDGGGSIRIPAGFTGLFGLKATYGRIPRGPGTLQPPLTVVVGCLSRSVRDTARWFDVCNGFHPNDTLSLPRVEGWEAGLDSFDLAGKRAVIAVDLGAAIVEPRGGGPAHRPRRAPHHLGRPDRGSTWWSTSPRAASSGSCPTWSAWPASSATATRPATTTSPPRSSSASTSPPTTSTSRRRAGPRCSASTSTSRWPPCSSRPTSSSAPPIPTPPSPPPGPCPPRWARST